MKDAMNITLDYTPATNSIFSVLSRSVIWKNESDISVNIKVPLCIPIKMQGLT